MEFRIRAAVPEDVGPILALERSVPEAPHWNLADYSGILDQQEAERVGVRRCLLVADVGCMHGGFAVGNVLFVGEYVEAQLESVVVAPGARRGGVGGALCRGVLAWCAEQGARTVDLEVRRGSAGAIALYRRLGFRETGVRPDYYTNPDEHAVLMQVDLRGCGEGALPRGQALC